VHLKSAQRLLTSLLIVDIGGLDIAGRSAGIYLPDSSALRIFATAVKCGSTMLAISICIP
jgi:hypothetical protein